VLTDVVHQQGARLYLVRFLAAVDGDGDLHGALLSLFLLRLRWAVPK
jgi:hypothetical protein